MARRKDDEITDGIVHIFRHVPWWVGPPAAIGVFVLFGYGLPALFGLVTPSNPKDFGRRVLQVLSTMSRIVGPMFGLFVAALWILALVERRRDRHRFDAHTGIESIRKLPWREFESLLAEYFRRLGYNVQTTPDGPDGGIDLILHKDGRETLVQAKHWKSWKVGVAPVRELLGVQASRRAAESILVTTGRFSPDARGFAEENRVRLIDGDALEPLILGVRQTMPGRRRAGSRDSPVAAAALGEQVSLSSDGPLVCPACGAVMVRRTARRGPHAGERFWGCSTYPACKEILPIE